MHQVEKYEFEFESANIRVASLRLRVLRSDDELLGKYHFALNGGLRSVQSPSYQGCAPYIKFGSPIQIQDTGSVLKEPQNVPLV